MIRSPAPYSLPIIPQSLPSEIMSGEHFVTTDLLDFLAGRAPSIGDPEVEALSREQALRASFVPSTSTSGGSSSALPVPGPEAGSVCPVGLPLLRKKIDPSPRVLMIKKKRTTQGKSARGAQMEDFIPWVRSEPIRPSLLEEEEEKEMTGLLDRYAARKRKREEEAEREAEGTGGTGGSVLPLVDGGSEIQTIMIPTSPEMGSNDQPGLKDIAHEEPREEAPIPLALQVVHPSERNESRMGAVGLALTGHKRLFPPD